MVAEREGSENAAEEGAKEETMEEEAGLLLPIDTLLSAGIHIGTRIKTRPMVPFIYRVRPDGLYVLDVNKTDERIRIAAKFISRFDPSRVVAVSARLYGRTPVQKFCEVTGTIPVTGRFLPGLFSNPSNPNHLDARLVVVTDPRADAQAVREASAIGIPVIAFCDTDNDFSGIDLVIPANNKGRRALATLYWLMARQVLRERRELPPDGDLMVPMEDFETKLAELVEASPESG
ncbi:MAG: 30S ribosomal protein S2 [Candidatus Bathyarchaeia archaeon]